ncbi:MAG: acyltransferase [Rikenellaceae bacterium]
MIRVISKAISKVKGESFELDPNISTSYFIGFMLSKMSALVWGILYVRRIGVYFIHPTTKLKCKRKLKFGKNLSIDRGCFINALSNGGVIMGDNCSIGKYTTIECTGSLKYIGKGISIGDNVGLGTHGFFGCAGGIEIGSDSIFGNYVSLHSENHNYDDLDIPIRLQGVSHKGITIGSNCWIGAKATILDGANIGDGCIVAAGAVVRGLFPPNSIIGGVPAKIIKSRES